MSSKFFNNETGHTLFDKLTGIASQMASFDKFLAVSGFFRSSGYFKLREQLSDVSEIKILVGINIDNIFRKHNKANMFLADAAKSKDIYCDHFKEDVINAKYDPLIERGILQMHEDLMSGRLEMKIHATKNLHAKFYLCLPNNHNEHTDGWVIMGSSNISDSGLGITTPPRYELNVAMKDYDDVKYCLCEFQKLWDAAIPLSPEDIAKCTKETYLGIQPTPYELYIKVLIDMFGDQVEEDFTLQLPKDVKELKYQKDAVIQGYQMLLQHHGLFLADVVGLGKTMIATMIAKRFVEANGKRTNILVIYPPALEENWKETFRLFNIQKNAQFITNGSLSKILNGKNQYKDKEEFDLIIVDEAHGFRNDGSGKYDALQKICKSSCLNEGLLNSLQKKVMLLSATPLNNSPEDLLNLLLLFQNSRNCTIDGIPNLEAFFIPFIKEYKKLIKNNEEKETDVTKRVEKIYEKIREKVIDKVTVRRTRNNILNDSSYKEDIESQGIIFPKILPPEALSYRMNEDTCNRFYSTLSALSDENVPTHLNYARYRAIEFLKPEHQSPNYKLAIRSGPILAGIYRVHMVKRLESSFHAFKKSLTTLLKITTDMIHMFEADKVIIAPEINIRDLLAKGWGLDNIIDYLNKKKDSKKGNVFPANAFNSCFLEKLWEDKLLLEGLKADWEKETEDPKFDLFKDKLENDLLSQQTNTSGKLVLFSESVDTLTYLQDRLTNELGRKDVLMVTAKNRNTLRETIKKNFDANSSIQENQYNIIITSDVLAEGVNLHRSHVIVNYDSPWNATKLMQRIGRVNRIGSVADFIYNYMFYPSQPGNQAINLYHNALVKLQGFHSAFGEDAQIYSLEEIVKQFKLFDSTIKDSVDKKIALLREIRDLYNNDRELYHKIKKLPMKSRVMRDTGHHRSKSIVFVSSNVKTEFYLADNSHVEVIGFLDAVDYLRAKPEEKPASFSNADNHYQHVTQALAKYQSEYIQAADTSPIKDIKSTLNKPSQEARKFLTTIKQIHKDNLLLIKECDTLIKYIDEGIYSKLSRRIRDLSREYKNDRGRIATNEYKIQNRISKLLDEYRTMSKEDRHQAINISDPQIIISETFI